MLRTWKFSLALVLGAAVVMSSGEVAEGQLGKLSKDKLGKLADKKEPGNVLTLADIEPKLADVPLGDMKFEDIKYDRIGKKEFDDFFKSSAKTHGLIVLNQQLAGSATKSLKKYAMSKAADEAMKENIAELVGDTPPEEWTVEQDIAVMQMAKQQDRISADEKRYFAQSAGTMAIGLAALSKGLGAVKELTEQGDELQKSISKLKKSQIPPATKGTKTSIDHLKEAQEKGPGLVEEIKVLTTAFQALSADE